MRNIERVILWGLPPTFCALVQRSGRAARDLTKLGEAILIVPKSVRAQGTTEEDVSTSLEDVNSEAEAQNVDPEVEDGRESESALAAELGDELAHNDGVYGTGGNVIVGERRENEGELGMDINGESDNEGATISTQKRRSKPKGEREVHEAKYLSQYASSTTKCLRKIWDSFFGNEKKGTLHKFSNLFSLWKVN